MTIKEICEASGLTKKAVAYYEEKGLICPDVRENGYREYRKEDVQTLREVACLRFYGLTVAQIRQVLESGDKAGTITALLVEKEEQLHWQKNCFRALCDLAKNYDLDKAEREKKALEAKQNIREKLRLAFPGSYGDYLSLHFGKYLGEPLDTPEKEEAYRKMVSFLDGLQLKEFSPELEQYLTQTMEPLPPQMWKKVDAAGQEAAVDPSGYLERHGEQLREYMQLMQTKKFQTSPAAQMKALLGDFLNSSGYYSIFLPNLHWPVGTGKCCLSSVDGGAETFIRRSKQKKGGERMQEERSQFVQKTVKTGISFGSALAMVISYTTWHSIGWAIFHGLLSWLYVIYFWIVHT